GGRGHARTRGAGQTGRYVRRPPGAGGRGRAGHRPGGLHRWEARRGGFAQPLGGPQPAPTLPSMILWNRSPKLPAKANGLTAFLDEGSEIEGRYTFTGVALLNGKFKGEIISTDTLIIGEKAVVNATIRAGAVVISGELVGGLLAAERVEMRKN